MSSRTLWRSFRRWHGIVLVVAALVSTVWLAITGQLILYIHPRYVVFTVIMAVIGLALVVASFVRPADHDHDDGEADDARPRFWRVPLSVAATVLTLVVAAAIIVVPPATLTTATAETRVVNSTTVGADAQSAGAAASASNASFAKFTVEDWASLLRQTSDPSFYQGKPADVVGFITADRDDPANLFYLTRFVITCCAVDAQPVAVPVYQPNWKDHLKTNDWVHVIGGFEANPSSASQDSIALAPTTTVKVRQPHDPYLY